MRPLLGPTVTASNTGATATTRLLVTPSCGATPGSSPPSSARTGTSPLPGSRIPGRNSIRRRSAPKTEKYPQPEQEEKKPVKPVPPAKVHQTITVGYREYPVEIPETVFNFFKENAVVPENTLWTKQEYILQTAVLLFAGYVDGATTIADNCGGAGSSATDDWGKKKPDENDMAFAKRCLERAQQLHVRPPRRGWHR